jgi:hypothetical protein
MPAEEMKNEEVRMKNGAVAEARAILTGGPAFRGGIGGHFHLVLAQQC